MSTQIENRDADRRMFQRRYVGHLKRTAGWPGTLPFVDILLLLFFFFVLQSRFVLQPGIRVRLPAAPFADGAPYSSLVVTISQEGMVFFNDQRTTMEGLRSAFQQAAYEHPDRALIVEADGRVLHSRLVDIYNMAEEAGLRDIVLATRLPPPAAGGP